MKLLALDAGLTAGFAVVEAGEPPATGSVTFPGNSTDKLGLLCVRFGHWLRDFLTSTGANGLVLCTPFISPKFQNIAVTKVLFAMYGTARAVCHSMEIPVYELLEPKVRKAMGVKAGGGRKKTKENVMQVCRDRGWYVASDHAGDALLAGAYQLGRLNQTVAIQTTPLFAAAPKRAPRRRRKAA